MSAKEFFFYVSLAGQVVNLLIAFYLFYNSGARPNRMAVIGTSIAISTTAIIGLMLAVFGGF